MKNYCGSSLESNRVRVTYEQGEESHVDNKERTSHCFIYIVLAQSFHAFFVLTTFDVLAHPIPFNSLLKLYVTPGMFHHPRRVKFSCFNHSNNLWNLISSIKLLTNWKRGSNFPLKGISHHSGSSGLRVKGLILWALIHCSEDFLLYTELSAWKGKFR